MGVLTEGVDLVGEGLEGFHRSGVVGVLLRWGWSPGLPVREPRGVTEESLLG